MIEALGCGCVVVASELPAVGDIIVDGKTGKTVPPAAPDRLARAIVDVMDDPDLSAPLVRAGREEALKKFDWSVVTENYRGLLQAVYGAGPE